MVKGKFEKSIPVDWGWLMDNTLRPSGIRIFKNGFSVEFRYTGQEQKQHFYSNIIVKYFGGARNGRMWINSFSYSVQHLPSEAQKEINKSPYRVAKHGLEVVGVSF